MKTNKIIAASFLALAVASATMTGCYEGDLYDIGQPDWMADSIASAAANKQTGSTEIEGLLEDIYTVGNTDYSTGWWASFSKYYVVPEDAVWTTQFTLNINPEASNTYKNFALIITNDVERGGDGYTEYGAIRYDYQPSGNSEWGDYIDRSLVTSNLEFSTDTDEGVTQLGGTVTLTIDRTSGGLSVTITNGTVTKTYTQTSALANLNADAANTNIRAFLVPEGSYINFIGTTIEPIGGCTSKEDKQPLSIELSGVPSEVLIGTELSEAMANVTGVVTFEQEVTKNVTAADLQFEAIPDMEEVGQKTLVVIYNKTFKGEYAEKSLIATKTFSVVKELSAFTQTLVVPSPTILGAEDNTSAWWSVHTENIKVAPKETKVVNFVNYSSGANNWNNFVIVLNDNTTATEYAVLRADNFGWGNGYAACTTSGGQADWATWLAAMDGAKVTAYISNNGDGTADVRTVMYGTDGVTYTQDYIGINTVDPDDMYFRFTIDGCHLEFETEVGLADFSTAWWTVHTTNVQVPSHTVCTINFTNYTSGANNWNNFLVVLNNSTTLTEYAVLRADNYGWGNGYAACTTSGGQADWATWLAAMDGAKCSVQIVNNGDGTADVKILMHGTDGVDYTQDYIGINTVDPDDLYFRFTVDGSYLVFE